MKHSVVLGTASLFAALAMPAHAAFVSLPSSGTIMQTCADSSTSSTSVACGAGSVSTATSGFSLAASTSRNIVAGSTNVGTLYDRVYRSGSTYIFGVRIDMNANTWGDPNDPDFTFEVNDIFRTGFASATSLEGGYSKTTAADEYLREVGRSNSGLNESGTGSFDADWVRFHTDINVDDPDDTSPGTSAWYWVKATGVSGFTTTTEAIRLWQGGEEGQSLYSILLSGYTPTYSSSLAASMLAPVPEPAEYAMFLAGLGVLGVMARRRAR